MERDGERIIASALGCAGFFDDVGTMEWRERGVSRLCMAHEEAGGERKRRRGEEGREERREGVEESRSG